MLDELKQGTAILHQEVERENLASLIMDGSITRQQYERLLRQNFMVYKGVEDFVNARYDQLPEPLKPFTGYEKTNSLAKDITSISNHPLPKALQVVGARNLETIVGKLYVIEGSMVGGMMMAKKIKDCPKISSIEQHCFYTGDIKESAARWKSFKDIVKSHSFTDQEVEVAIDSAKETFLLFKEAYKY